ncbi:MULTISPECIES: hypothetical protein [unclassified Bradyrhizobium]|uniref:hypothetical protein n=1 Tax=unclassified Bradyrhizobium TaxID=2631580 RepID=UPI001FFAAE78|nr:MULTISPECIES: hypothetical protein [unclassified Bradyrhizobium]MCK1302935.1 hypothetical protein [Bradyrhizobium sp. 37]MCK1772431.1 hypothetical protein [Bradyrhizobium sp. 134]
MGKTGPKCSICSHKSRHQIEIGLAHGIAHNALARRFNVSADAVGRHAANHVSPAMRAAILTAQKPTEIDLEALQTSEQEGLLSQLVHQRARLQQHVATAIDFADIKAAISAEGAITANLALVGKLLGMIVQRHDVRSTSLLISADYLAVRQAIVNALRPFPAASQAVGAALHRLESDAAHDITRRAGKPLLVIDAQAITPPPCPVPPPC